MVNFIDYYVDDSSTKQNTFFPGTNSKVINWDNKISVIANISFYYPGIMKKK